MLSPQGPGLLTQLCGQHGEVVPDTSLAVQEHRCSDSAVFGLNGEATLWIRVGEDGVPRGNGTDLGAATSPLPLLSPLLILLSRAVPATQGHRSGWSSLGGPKSWGTGLDRRGRQGETQPVFQTRRLCSGNPGTCVSSLVCLRPAV